VSNVEQFEILVLGSGEAGKYLAWTMAKAGHRTAMVERRWLGGSCPNVACLPSKNLIYSARVASLARRRAEFGLETNSLAVSMKDVQRRKRLMVEGLHQMHVARTVASGAELITGEGRFERPTGLDLTAMREILETPVQDLALDLCTWRPTRLESWVGGAWGQPGAPLRRQLPV
jgi:pyruvate/2-oxoglutarate dehydrogenase complex dihydrolipoamide dehydrogenase (E3) component